MITPRATHLIRAVDLQAFHRAIVSLVPADAAARDCAVIVPTRTAADQLRRILGPQTQAHLVTRDEFYDQLRERIPGAPAAVTALDREVRLRRAANLAAAEGIEPPFNVRAGLVREMLSFYDALRRRHRTVADFDRLMSGSLEPSAGHDRGAERLLAQTRFLAATFATFEGLAAAGGVDEHHVRTLALASPVAMFRRVVVAVADQAADPRGLWSADFDLLARMPFLDALDIVATESMLGAGYYERLHERELPGIEDVRFESPPAPLPVLLVPDPPPGAEPGRAFVCRDREEELARFARYVKSRPDAAAVLNRSAIVFQRPLPYLYLAREVFADAHLPYQALDSLPLAAEPFAAAVDLVFSAIAADFTRSALVDLLRSPHFAFQAGDRPLTADDVHALDRQLVKRKYLGGAARLAALADAEGGDRRFRECAAAAAATAGELESALSASTSPEQIDGLLAFIRGHERLPLTADAWYERHMRARGAILEALENLRDAHAAQDPSHLSTAELSGAVRRWIEGQTFTPRLGETGVVLLDASAAAYADVDELRIVGMTEADWPARGARSIFYPQSLLSQLGWPSDQDRLAAARAQFHDLMRLPRRRLALSTILLEDDSVVSASPLLEDVDASGLPIERLVAPAVAPTAAVFTHEALMADPVPGDCIAGAAAEWLAVRRARTFEDARFRGAAGPRTPDVYAVSRLERYLECPFKYFAAHVLRLEEERDEEAWLTPQERGHFVHDVFEEFFAEWQRDGRGAITTANAGDAMARFEAVAERHIARLPEGDRALERTLLLGSAVAAGFGERAFAFEIEDEVAVIERLLEHEFRGTFAFAGEDGARTVDLRAKSDRIDLLDDGTLRIVDYKLGRAPDRKKALQLPVYGVCAAQALDGRHGRRWTLARAGYIAFKEKTAFVELQPLDKSVADGQARLLATVDAIEAGAFPVQPDEPFLCTWCAYPSVCRKDYVGDE